MYRLREVIKRTKETIVVLERRECDGQKTAK